MKTDEVLEKVTPPIIAPPKSLLPHPRPLPACAAALAGRGSLLKRRVREARVEVELFSLLPLLLFISCVGPAYMRPAIEVPPAFEENNGWKTAEPRDSVVRGAWWTIFGDTLLDSLEQKAALANQTIAIAQAQYEQARSAIAASRAGYFPTFSAQGSATRVQRSATLGQSGVSAGGGAATASDFLLSGDVSWEPDIWGKVRRLTEANKAAAQASAADLESALLSVQAQLAQSYFQIRILDEQKRIIDSAAADYQTFLDLTSNRYKSGVATQADVLQAQAQLKSAQAQAVDLGVQRAFLEHAAAVILGQPAPVFAIAPSPLSAIVPVLPPVLPSSLLERRPDIAGAERRVAAANAQIGAAQAAYFPNISLNAAGGWESGILAKLFTVPSELWSLGALAAGVIFDAGLRGAQVDEARALYKASAASYRQTALIAFQEVEDYLASLRLLEEEGRLVDEAVSASRKSLELEIIQYKQGTVSALDVVTTQTVELNNRKTAVGILGGRMSAAVLLIKALGGGWDTSQLPK